MERDKRTAGLLLKLLQNTPDMEVMANYGYGEPYLKAIVPISKKTYKENFEPNEVSKK